MSVPPCGIYGHYYGWFHEAGCMLWMFVKLVDIKDRAGTRLQDAARIRCGIISFHL